ncbi:MAG: hypothetical protein HOO67_05035 [Candidatus Peribacteraceae bacterium]|nr:hypothetical protein [Candidatus Peribacteraceae bacterium]
MNIILKSFDGRYDHLTMERAFRDISVETCISLNWDLREIPKLNAKEHLLFNSREYKACRYDGVDWSVIPPLDEEVIEKMRPCEAVFMNMITRNSLTDIPYAERRRQYFDHLRYWNHLLDSKKIDLLLLNHPPHQSYDLVIYDLCRLKGIQTMLVDRICPGLALVVETWEESATDLRDLYAKLREEYRDSAKPIPLSSKLEDYWQGQTVRNDRPWFMYPRQKHLLKRNFFRKWSGKALEFLYNKPQKFFSVSLSRDFWRRKLREHRTIVMYDDHAAAPDFSKPYVYIPLQMQPEATTCPQASAFVDQEKMVQLLAWHLPKDVLIYIKEHPHQGEQQRSVELYKKMLDIPAVRFVPRNTDTFALAENSIAVATCTGTAGFEALFRQKPVFVFGHVFYQYCAGAHMIHTSEDCRRAVESVVQKKEKPSLRDVRIFLKAIEALSSHFECGPLGPGEHFTPEEQCDMFGELIAKKIEQVRKK